MGSLSSLLLQATECTWNHTFKEPLGAGKGRDFPRSDRMEHQSQACSAVVQALKPSGCLMALEVADPVLEWLVAVISSQACCSDQFPVEKVVDFHHEKKVRTVGELEILERGRPSQVRGQWAPRGPSGP